MDTCCDTGREVRSRGPTERSSLLCCRDARRLWTLSERSSTRFYNPTRALKERLVARSLVASAGIPETVGRADASLASSASRKRAHQPPYTGHAAPLPNLGPSHGDLGLARRRISPTWPVAVRYCARAGEECACYRKFMPGIFFRNRHRSGPKLRHKAYSRNLGRLDTRCGWISLLRPLKHLRKSTSRTCDFHIRIKPKTFRNTGRGMTEGSTAVSNIVSSPRR
jgi:hypothetical protein